MAMNLKLLPLLALGTLSGCVSLNTFGDPRLHITSANQTKFVEQFPEAYATQSLDGVYDIVLRSSDLQPRSSQKDASVLLPAAGVPVSQLVHLRVYWRPARGAKANSPAAANSTLHWYVLANPLQDHPDYIRYDGAGFVKVSRDGAYFDVDILNGDLKVAARRGTMRDPIGPAQLTGYFQAKIDPQRVQALLAGLPTP